MSEPENQRGCTSVVQVLDEFTLSIKSKNQLKSFNYDSCFGPNSSQEAVFEDTKRLVQSAIDGFNVCIFAYGQTGSGKTYTIQGDKENPGIAPRSLAELYKTTEMMKEYYEVSIDCYMVELYIDKLYDLLLTKDQKSSFKAPPQLEIKEDQSTNMVYIQNAVRQDLPTYEEAMKVYKHGLVSRRTGATDMNQTSSRSHLIFSILIQMKNKQTQQVSVYL